MGDTLQSRQISDGLQAHVDRGRTALMYAAAKGRDATVLALVSALRSWIVPTGNAGPS